MQCLEWTKFYTSYNEYNKWISEIVDRNFIVKGDITIAKFNIKILIFMEKICSSIKI